MEPEAHEEGHEVPVTPFRARRRGRVASGGVNAVLVVGLAMTAVAVAGLVLTMMKDSAVYSKPVDEVVREKARFLGRPVRVDGSLVHGSLEHRPQPCEYRFTIARNGVEVPVRYPQCVVPDTFRDVPDMDVGVTVEGSLRADGSFDATQIFAKCPSKYEMRERKDRGEATPHGAIPAAGLPAAGSPGAP